MDFLSPYDVLDHISKNCDMPPLDFSQIKTFFLDWIAIPLDETEHVFATKILCKKAHQ